VLAVNKMDLVGFEQAVFDQRPTSADHYDASYFTDAWRAEGND